VQATVTTPRAILDAALACFSEAGYEQTTIEQIRARSGASIGSIYHHFGGKDQIAVSLYLEALGDYQAGLLALLGPGPAERTVKALVRHHLRWVEANPQLARFLLAPRPTALKQASAARLRELNRAAFDALQAWRRGHEQELQPIGFDAFYATVFGPAQEASRHRLAGRSRTSMSRLERELAAAAWRSIKGDDI